MAMSEAVSTVAGKTRFAATGNRENGSVSSVGAMLERVMPHNQDAEEGLLACCIFDGGQEVLATCLEAKIAPESFFVPTHQAIFEAILKLHDAGTAIDEITLADNLSSRGKAEETGGYGALTRLTSRIETTAHARFWMEIVREKYLLRRLIRTSTSVVDRCFRQQGELEQFLEEVEQEVFLISQDRVTDSAVSIKESIDSAVNLIQAMLQRRGELSGVPTGFVDLDRLTFGFHAQEVIVLAARPSVGKTALATNIAQAAILPKEAQREPVPTLIFELEMSAEQLAMRLLCSHARVNMMHLSDGFRRKEEERRLAQSAKVLKQGPLWIDDSGNITILELRAKARRIHARHPLGLVIIDYLQLLSGTDARVGREQQIAEISRGIKAMAKELKVPVLVLSQLNRESERERRQPRLSDLRESGAIEQDADVVLLLSRPARSDDKTAPVEDVGERDLIIAKQRNGPVGSIRLTFIPEQTRFENYTHQAI